jgi:hypothetical protein
MESTYTSRFFESKQEMRLQRLSMKNYTKIFNSRCVSATHEMPKQKALILFISKLIYHDKFIHSSSIEYTGQYKTTNDDHFDNLINQKIAGRIFVKDKCYTIIRCEMTKERISKHHHELSKHGRKYLLEIQEIPKSIIIKHVYPEYYDATEEHPVACNKLRAMADYGVVPENFQSLTEGVLLGSFIE